MSKLSSLLSTLLVTCALLTACSKSSQPQSQTRPATGEISPTPISGGEGQQLNGPGEGGGGDPDTQLFIVLSRKLSVFFRENPSRVDLPFQPQAFEEIVSRLDKSIKDPTLADLVEFTPEPLKDQNLVSKVALFNQHDFTIKVNRPYWTAANDQDKLILITMEITGLLGAELRYEKARDLVQGKVPLILVMTIPGDGEKTPINWHIAGQDANIFARITAGDVLIDGGVIGTGSTSNQRIARFLANPLQDQEWMALARQAFQRQMPAYIILRDQAGLRASITGFRETATAASPRRPGLATYSLLFSAKSTPVGACSHTSTELSALDRLRNCFFDVRFYSLWDAQIGRTFNENDEPSRQKAWLETFQELSERLVNHFANSTATLAATLRNALLQDYSSLLPVYFQTKIMREASLAGGLLPSLLKGETAFWEMTTKRNSKSVRFVAALEAMAKDRVGLYPGHESRCIADVQTGDLAPMDEPRLVPLAELHKLFEVDTCLLRQNENIESILYWTLATSGYVYNSATATWTKAERRTVSNKLMLGQFVLAREIETQAVCENLQANSFLLRLKQTLRASDLIGRLGIYAEVLPKWSILGLSQAQVEGLYRDALADILSIQSAESPSAPDSALVWRFNKTFPLTEFVNRSLERAIFDQLISPSLSKEFVTKILGAPWLNREMAYELIYNHFSSQQSRQTQLPYFRVVMSELLRRPFFDADLASSLVRDIVKPYYGVFSGSGTGALPSYSDLNSLLQLTVSLGKLSAEDTQLLEPYIPMFQRAADFESQVKARNLNPEAQARLLKQLLKTPAEAALLADVVTRFLLTTQVSTASQNALLEELMNKTGDLPDQQLKFKGLSEASGLLPALTSLPFLIELTKTMQEKIFTFIFIRLKGRGENAAWARAVIAHQLVDQRRWRVTRLPGAQLALEQIAESSTESRGDNFDLAPVPIWEYSETNKIMNALQNCKTDGMPQSFCRDLSSPKTILQKIAANQNLHEGLRKKATALLTSLL